MPSQPRPVIASPVAGGDDGQVIEAYKPVFDIRTLVFAAGFPLLLTVAFILAAVGLRAELPEPLMLDAALAGGRTSFGGYVAAGAVHIWAIGFVLLALGALHYPPAPTRRFLMGLGICAALYTSARFTSGLLGQRGLAEAAAAPLDQTALGMGTGAAVALGIIMAFAYKPMTPERVGYFVDQPPPEPADVKLAATGDVMTMRIKAGPRTYRAVAALTLAAAAISVLAAWWLAAVAVVIGLATVSLVSARVVTRPRGVSVYAGGFLRVLFLPMEEIDSARTGTIQPLQYGGWGYRISPESTAFVTAEGSSVVLDVNGNAVVISGSTPLDAKVMAGLVNGYTVLNSQ